MDLTNNKSQLMSEIVIDGYDVRFIDPENVLQPSDTDWPYQSGANLRRKIIDLIEDGGESLLNDDGVDSRVSEKIADEIIKLLVRTPRIIVHVSGGVVNDVVGDAPFEYTVKDFDNIKEGDDVFDVNQSSTFGPGRLIDPSQMQKELEDELTEEQMDRR